MKRIFLLAALLLAGTVAMAQTAPAPSQAPVRLRGTIEKVEPGSITIKERSGEVITLVRPADLVAATGLRRLCKSKACWQAACGQSAIIEPLRQPAWSLPLSQGFRIFCIPALD